MMILKNKLKEMEEENRETLAQITSAENKKELSNMFRYVSSFPLSLYQTQIVYKDLLGMALEAERQHLTLREKLGIEPLAFCDDIIESAGPDVKCEHFFKAVIDTMHSFAFYYTFSYFFFYSMPAEWGISVAEIILFALWCGIMNHLTKFWAGRTALKSGTLHSKIPHILFVFLTIILFIAVKKSGVGQIYAITGTGWILVLIVDTITILSTLVWNRYISKTE